MVIMSEFSLEINEDDVSLLKAALSCYSKELSNTRVVYTAAELSQKETPYRFKEQEDKIVDLRKRLSDLV